MGSIAETITAEATQSTSSLHSAQMDGDNLVVPACWLGGERERERAQPDKSVTYIHSYLKPVWDEPKKMSTTTFLSPEACGDLPCEWSLFIETDSS